MYAYGWLSQWPMGIWMGLCITGYLALGFVGARLFTWTLYSLGLLWLLGAQTGWWIGAGVFFAVMNVPVLRQFLVSNFIFQTLKRLNIMPEISETERVALEAGSTWVEKELFSGMPNFNRITKEPYRKVSSDEQKFLDGPVNKVCQMVNDWDLYQHKDLPNEVWDFLKREKFFGMIIPKEYDGLGFSAIANSEVVAKISSRSVTLAVTVMVPNSLGPAELLIHYGTEEQKNYYLPRLARGEEIPCFALTEPGAGSDAGSIQSEGIVFKGTDGKLYIKLHWEKRYITLAAVSTLVGLAIKLRDPENHLGRGEHLGITCVLVPASTKGVVLGRRHNPMGVPFYNCPTSGNDVVVSIDQIIGGAEGAGKGWQMLMECLAAGRSISLPAQSTGIAKLVARVTSAYSFIRKQFGISIKHFEGVEEPLARIGGMAYLMEASRIFTVGAVDQGLKPSVVSAIAKYNATELGRKVINDGMDILGGAAISRGPRNLLANIYISTPISITVEGANILTRSMIIFGQGAIRCHPYAWEEMKALGDNHLGNFDRAFWGHIGLVMRNTCRALLLSLTHGHLAKTPGGVTRQYYRRLAWSSASFSVMADLALGLYGGGLKLKEKITGRYADILSWMYLATATLRRFEAEGQKPEHRPYLDWAMAYSFSRIQEGFDGIYANFDAPLVGWFFKGPVKLWSRFNRIASEPTDIMGHRVVEGFCKPGDIREALTEGIYIPKEVQEALGRYEHAFKVTYESSEIFAKIKKAVHAKKLPKGRPETLLDKACEAGIITQADVAVARQAEVLRTDAIQVDSFTLDEFASALCEPTPIKKSVNH